MGGTKLCSLICSLVHTPGLTQSVWQSFSYLGQLYACFNAKSPDLQRETIWRGFSSRCLPQRWLSALRFWSRIWYLLSEWLKTANTHPKDRKSLRIRWNETDPKKLKKATASELDAGFKEKQLSLSESCLAETESLHKSALYGIAVAYWWSVVLEAYKHVLCGIGTISRKAAQ